MTGIQQGKQTYAPYLGLPFQRAWMALTLQRHCCSFWAFSLPVYRSLQKTSHGAGSSNILVYPPQPRLSELHAVVVQGLTEGAVTLSHLACPHWLSGTMEEEFMTPPLILISPTMMKKCMHCKELRANQQAL